METTKTTRTVFMLSLVFLLFSLMDVCSSDADIVKRIHLKDGSVIQCDVCWLDLGWLMNENAPVLYEQGEDLKMIAISFVDLEKTFGKDTALNYEKTWAEKRRRRELLKRAKELREQGGSNVAGTSFDFDRFKVDNFRVKRKRISGETVYGVYKFTFDLTNIKIPKRGPFAPRIHLSLVAYGTGGVVLKRTNYFNSVYPGETVFCQALSGLRKERVPKLSYWTVERKLR
jgi:hypothetical protein